MLDCLLDFLLDVMRYAIGPLVAVLVAISVQIKLARQDEKRQARRAFAEALDQCCDVMENATIHYWMDGDSKTEVLVGTMNATLIKINRLILDASCISPDEAKQLTGHWQVIQKALKRDFGVANRRIDPERMIIVVGIILGVRCEAAKLRA